MIKINIRNILMSGAVFGMMVSLIVGTVINNIEVNGISKACQNSAACREAVAKEEEANKNAAAASNSVSNMKMKGAHLFSDLKMKYAWYMFLIMMHSVMLRS